jgi:tryptophan synthase beta chain
MQTMFTLDQNDLPRRWYNVLPDLPTPLDAPLHPGTREPIEPEALLGLFARTCVEQEGATDRWIDIPDAVLDVYRRWRPTPLLRAANLERALDTPAHIYLKYEGASPTGSHKTNTAVPQAYYNKIEGTKNLATETGAGQWGSALAFACQMFGLGCTVFMVRSSYDQKPYRKAMMSLFGARVHASPSAETQAGRDALARDRQTPGSLGLAISEAVEAARSGSGTKYSLGSVLNHVCLHQTVVGQECLKQMEMAGEEPDILIGCVGGGSNFAGLVFPFVPDKLKGENIRFVAVEPTSCPTFTKGAYTYDFGDTVGLTPMMLMYTLGHSFVPPGIHAGGLRYHGDAPLLSLLVHEKVIEAKAYPQNPVFEAAITFARTEGIVPAPETSHALRAGIDEALICKETGEEKCIVIGFSGHGFLDLAAYDAFIGGKLEDFEYPDSMIQEAICAIPKFPG